MSRFAFAPVFCLSLALLACGCNKNNNQDSAQLYQSQNRPVVAIVPLIDRTSNPDISWSLSEELTTGLRRQLQQRDKLYLLSEQKMHALTKNLKDSYDPFGIDVSWAKQVFAKEQFVVFLELLEHDEVAAYKTNQNSTQSAPSAPADLNMSIRIRILDLRSNRPQIVLQEIVHDSHHLPKQFTKAHFDQIAWGKENYHVTPLGMAHAALTKEVVSRVEDYILLAATR